MSSFDSNAFDPSSFDAGSFDLEAAPAGSIAGSAALSFSASGALSGVSVIPTRSPRLYKVADGRAWLAHSRTATRSRPLAASGFVLEAPVTSAGYGALQSAKVVTRASSLRTVSGACSSVRGSRASTRGFTLSSSAGCRVGVAQASAMTWAGLSSAVGAASSSLGSAQSVSACERVRARGVRNISDYELAAVVRLIDTRR